MPLPDDAPGDALLYALKLPLIRGEFKREVKIPPLESAFRLIAAEQRGKSGVTSPCPA